MAFTPLKKVLESVMRGQDLSSDIEAYRVFSQWGDIVGQRLAAHARPARVSRDVLYVEVDDNLWLTQLKYMKADMLKRLDRGIKPGLFKDLKFFLKGLQ